MAGYFGEVTMRDYINPFLRKKKSGIRNYLRRIHVTNNGQLIIAVTLLCLGVAGSITLIFYIA